MKIIYQKRSLLVLCPFTYYFTFTNADALEYFTDKDYLCFLQYIDKSSRKYSYKKSFENI